MKKKFNLESYQIKYLKQKLKISKVEEIDTALLKNLKEQIKEELIDVRQQGKITYKLWDIVICVIIADFANIYDWEDIEDFVKIKYKWLKSFLQMTGGVPDAQTYERVMSLIDSKELEQMLVTFLMALVNNQSKEKDIKCFDGRVSKSSARNKTDYNEKEKPLNCLNVYSTKYGICLTSEMIDEKTNEIPAFSDVLDYLDITDSIVSCDALNTQTANAFKVIKKEGDYVFAVKGNQGNLYQDLIDYFDEERLEMIKAGNTQSSYLATKEKSHTSLITYEYYQTSDVNWYFDKESWRGLRSFGVVRKTITKNEETTIEMRYYISSLNVDIYEFSRVIRSYWSVENKLHWHLDFTFRQDKNTTKNKKALMNLEIINKFVLAILNKVKPCYGNISLKRIRSRMALDFETEFVQLLAYLALL